MITISFGKELTLEAIFRNSGNEKEADKVVSRMQSAEMKLIQKNQKTATAGKKTKENKKKKEGYIPKGKCPDVTNLKIVQKDDPLQFNDINEIDERSCGEKCPKLWEKFKKNCQKICQLISQNFCHLFPAKT